MMTLTLELTPEQEQHLEEEARRQNMDAASYAKALLFEEEAAEQLEPAAAQSAEEPWSGADLVAYWEREGVIGSRPDITDSLEHARAIRRKAERRIRE
jgi:hypothetical protein